MRARFLSGLLLLVLIAAFFPTLASFHGVWTGETYTHGYLVAALVVWLAWDRLQGGLPLRRGRMPPGLYVLLVGLSLAWMAALVMNIQVVHQGLIPTLMVAWGGAVGGWAGVLTLLPAASVFLFAVPLWEVFVGPLQRMTILVSGTSARVLGLEAEIHGDFIVLPGGIVEIAGTCAGLNLFVVGLLLGTTYSWMFLTRPRYQVVVILGAGLAAMAANWIRVTGLVVIADMTEMTHPLLDQHVMYGWVIFAGTFLLFGLGLRPVERWDRDGRSMEEGQTSNEASDGPAPPSRDRRRLVGVATALIMVGPLAHVSVGALPATDIPEPTRTQPQMVQGWARAPSSDRPSGWRPEFRGADVEESWVWTKDDWRLYHDRRTYYQQRQGAELVGYGNRIADPSAILAERLQWLPEARQTLREAVIQMPDGRVLVWYRYNVSGVWTTSRFWAKALELWGFLSRRPTALVEAFSMPCTPSGECAPVATQLRDFVQAGEGR